MYFAKIIPETTGNREKYRKIGGGEKYRDGYHQEMLTKFKESISNIRF